MAIPLRWGRWDAGIRRKRPARHDEDRALRLTGRMHSPTSDQHRVRAHAVARDTVFGELIRGSVLIQALETAQ